LLIQNITYPEQPEIWKLVAVFAPMTYWKGNFSGSKYSWSDYVFDYNVSFYTQAYVSLPYVLALGTFSFNFTLKSVDCFDCKLYTCVNNYLSVNWSSQALFILRARKDVWFPINLTREWQHSPLEGLMTKVVSKLLTQSKKLFLL
jgi:hypothetical protein